MKRYNIWNIIFHNSEVNKNIEDYKFQQSLVNSYEYWLTKIGNANTLTECMALHKYIWRQGFKNTNLGPDKYGMFRAKDINAEQEEEYPDKRRDDTADKTHFLVAEQVPRTYSA